MISADQREWMDSLLAKGYTNVITDGDGALATSREGTRVAIIRDWLPIGDSRGMDNVPARRYSGSEV